MSWLWGARIKCVEAEILVFEDLIWMNFDISYIFSCGFPWVPGFLELSLILCCTFLLLLLFFIYLFFCFAPCIHPVYLGSTPSIFFNESCTCHMQAEYCSSRYKGSHSFFWNKSGYDMHWGCFTHGYSCCISDTTACFLSWTSQYNCWLSHFCQPSSEVSSQCLQIQ